MSDKKSQEKVFAGSNEEVWSAIFSSDSKRVLTSGRGPVAHLYDAQSGKPLCEFTIKYSDVAGNIEKVRLFGNATKEYALTTGTDRKARIWDVTNCQTQTEPLKEFSHSTNYTVNDVAFSSDGTQIFTAGYGDEARAYDVKLWAIDTGKLRRVVFGGQAYSFTSIAVSHDGRSLLTTSVDSTARLWDIQTGVQKQLFPHFTDYVRYGVFSSDDKKILTASEDDSARPFWMRQESIFMKNALVDIIPGTETVSGMMSKQHLSVFVILQPYHGSLKFRD